MSTPRYLSDYAALWERDPKQANLKWFEKANWGLFMHYGLYSQLGRGEWVQLHEKIPIAEYEKLFETFKPDKFDADYITDLALEAEMKYINVTACHHEGFCLWKSDTEAFNSYAACGRDLVRELAEQCDRKGLGFFTYYTHVLNWRHPWAMTRDRIGMARPDYPHPEPRYKLTKPEEYKKYWAYAYDCMKELLALEYPLAGLWLDIIYAYYVEPDLIPIEATYEMIREIRPEVLISFKQGATGTEDYASPEYSFNSQGDRLRKDGKEEAARIADAAWEKNRVKHNEICMTLQTKTWGYNADVAHLNADDVWKRLAYAMMNNCNMLTNVGPLADGTIHEEDVRTLREMGARIRREGWPPPEDAITPESWTIVKAGAAAQ